MNHEHGTKSLTETPNIDSSAEIRQSQFGRYCEVGARTRIAESTFGDYSYCGDDNYIINLCK